MTEVDLNASLAPLALNGTIALADAPWPDPVPVPDAVEGRPMARIIYLVDEQDRQAGIWTCTPGSFQSSHVGYVEVMHVVDGEGDLRGEDGTVWEVCAGDLLVIPAGWVGTWHVTKTVTKSFAIFRGDL